MKVILGELAGGLIGFIVLIGMNLTHSWRLKRRMRSGK